MKLILLLMMIFLGLSMFAQDGIQIQSETVEFDSTECHMFPKPRAMYDLPVTGDIAENLRTLKGKLDPGIYEDFEVPNMPGTFVKLIVAGQNSLGVMFHPDEAADANIGVAKIAPILSMYYSYQYTLKGKYRDESRAVECNNLLIKLWKITHEPASNSPLTLRGTDPAPAPILRLDLQRAEPASNSSGLFQLNRPSPSQRGSMVYGQMETVASTGTKINLGIEPAISTKKIKKKGSGIGWKIFGYTAGGSTTLVGIVWGVVEIVKAVNNNNNNPSIDAPVQQIVGGSDGSGGFGSGSGEIGGSEGG